MTQLYPLRFEPLYRRYLWGGRRLQSLLGKSLGAGDDYAESWEVVDHGADQSVVAAGPLQGWTLAKIIAAYGRELFGRHFDAMATQRFPLLFKFLDCQRTLSVQVHPDDDSAARLDPSDLGKTEAWVILHAEPGSLVYAGLKRGFDRAALEREVQRGTTELCLHRFEPRVGDCVFIPAGVVHALGAGLVVAEIQQSSDTTFRLFDWNRVGPEGRPRQLHVDAALDAINYAAGPVSAAPPLRTDLPHVQRLVACDKFILDRWQLADPRPIGGDDRFRIVVVIGGEIGIEHDGAAAPLRRGEVMLFPAATPALTLTPRDSAELLVAYLP